MTEYDYSPEAYERHLATQNRIANWVDTTEQHRPQFEHAVGPSAAMRPRQPSYDSYSKPKRSPPTSPLRQQYANGGHHWQQQQPRQLFVHAPPPPDSESSEEYGDGPGPMPLPLASPGMMFAPQHGGAAPGAFHHMAPPMVSPPPMMMPPTYMTAPHHRPSAHHRHRSHSAQLRSRSHQSAAYYNMASPPVSSGYQYGYPPVMGGSAGHPGYFMMHHPHRAAQVPVMYL
ncbi:hypothetical protein BDZ97DRAFT_1236515 [Flammula alnicola]|nr:hypothetical protein BDZ97DRAFT_1236515 [Flammula alnicola]